MKSTLFKDFLRESFTPPSKSNYNSQDHNRIEFFDLAKGVCIILVVLCHIDNISSIPNFNALRMPLYFVLSGFFFKAYEPKVFFIKKVNNIAVPFVFWLFVSDILRMGDDLYLHRETVDFSLIHFIKTPFLHRSEIETNAPLWFLICLFITNIIFYIVYSICKSSKKICFAVTILAFVGYICFRNGIKLSLWIDSSLLALPFFVLGYFCRYIPYLKSEYSMKKSLLLGMILIITSYIIYYTFGHPHIIIGQTFFQGNFILCYLNSMTMVMGVLLLCKVIKWLPVVSYFGRYSIVVLCVHMLIIFYFTAIFEKCSGHEVATNWERVIIVMMMCWFSIPVCKKWLPYFVAQKSLFKVKPMGK